jgi:hypothetical protein
MRLPRDKKKKMITTQAEFKKSLDTGSWGPLQVTSFRSIAESLGDGYKTLARFLVLIWIEHLSGLLRT